MELTTYYAKFNLFPKNQLASNCLLFISPFYILPVPLAVIPVLIHLL
nr:MAG TPA: hypothetical protein [Bacteriophage sp.]